MTTLNQQSEIRFFVSVLALVALAIVITVLLAAHFTDANARPELLVVAVVGLILLTAVAMLARQIKGRELLLVLFIVGVSTNVFQMISRHFAISYVMVSLIAATGFVYLLQRLRSDDESGNPVAVVARMVSSWFAASLQIKVTIAAMGLYFLSGFVSLIYAGNLTAASDALFAEGRYLVAVVFVAMLIADRRTFYVAFAALALGAIASGALGLISLVPGLPAFMTELLAPVSNGTGLEYRVAGMFGDPNSFARYQLIGMPLVMALIVTAKTRLAVVLWCLGFLVLAAGLVASESRTSLLAAPFVITGFLFLARKQISALFVLTMIVGIVMASVVFVATVDVSRMQTSIGDMQRILNFDEKPIDPATSGRISEQKAALEAWRDRPVFGHGIGNFAPQYEHYSQIHGLRMRNQPRAAHSLYLELLAERGLIGCGLYLLFVSILICSLLRRTLPRASLDSSLPEDENSNVITIALVVALGSYLVTGLMLHNVFSLPIWVFIGTAIGSLRLGANTKSDRLVGYTSNMDRI